MPLIAALVVEKNSKMRVNDVRIPLLLTPDPISLKRSIRKCTKVSSGIRLPTL
jgi:hypothetical protein